MQLTEADVLTAKVNIEFIVIKAPAEGPTSRASPPECMLVEAEALLTTSPS